MAEGKTKEQVTWNSDALFSYLTTLIAEREKQSDERWAAQEKAIAKAEAAVDKRLESMNEFRGQIKDMTATLITRHEYDQAIKAILDKIEDLKSYADMSTGKSSGLSLGWAVLLGAISLLGPVGAFMIYLNK